MASALRQRHPADFYDNKSYVVDLGLEGHPAILEEDKIPAPPTTVELDNSLKIKKN